MYVDITGRKSGCSEGDNPSTAEVGPTINYTCECIVIYELHIQLLHMDCLMH